MPYFDRFDICEAYLLMDFKPHVNLSFETLSENAREIYRDLCARYDFEFPRDYEPLMTELK